MKYSTLSRCFYFGVVCVVSFTFGFLLCNYFDAQESKNEYAANFYKLDAYSARSFLTILDSVGEENGKFSYYQFVRCALEDQYKRVDKNIELLNQKNRTGSRSIYFNEAIVLLEGVKNEIDLYWTEEGKFDCKGAGWKN